MGQVSAREMILGALLRGAFDAALPGVYAGVPGPAPARALTRRFMERAAEVGTEVHLVTPPELPGAIVAAVMEESARDVVIWDDPLLGAPAQALRNAGVTVTLDEIATQEQVAAAAFGITTAAHAIAETGTLVLDSAPGRSRGASLLPVRHVAVLPESRIRADIFALLDDLGRPLPSALTFITGPSRSADIGLTPVRPAHGPVSVTVFVVTDTRQ